VTSRRQKQKKAIGMCVTIGIHIRSTSGMPKTRYFGQKYHSQKCL